MPAATRVRLPSLVNEEAEGFAAILRARIAQQQAARDEAPSNLIAYAEKYRRLDGNPFSLSEFGPLTQIYEDTHPHMVIQKPAQRGVSEYAINRAIFALDRGADVWCPGQKDGLNVGYIFPTQDALRDFSKERFSGLRDESPYLQALFGIGDDFDGVTFKKVNKSYLYLRGGWSTAGLKSFPADMIILDEFDEMDAKAVALARRRMNASVLHHELDLSTPSLPGMGINGQYLQSDQHVYEQPCPYCGQWNEYEFFRDVFVGGQPYDDWRTWTTDHIRRSVVNMRCPQCKTDLDNADRCVMGRWVARQPEVESPRGYLVPSLAFPRVRLMELAVTAVSQNPEEITEFYRSDLGLPYAEGGSQITRAMLEALSSELPGGELPRYAEWRRTTMGVDVGNRLHFRITSSAAGYSGRFVRRMGSVTSWDEIETLIRQYNVRRCVVDALPDIHATQEFAARPGLRTKVMRAYYPSVKSFMKGETFHADEDSGTINVNRTAAMDAVYARIAGGTEYWPADIHGNDEVINHMTAPKRVAVIDKTGQTVAAWVHTKPDHLFHASVYDLIAYLSLPRVRLPAGAATIQGSVSGGWGGGSERAV